ncbi:hypothetical protein EMCG_06194 [[Emmonsia] crescens]|uniref:Uncharacterized protein n=1 Tax=[Emmonsia] crescens TaxID=73230 RepID=A0A0G2IBV0_9EURO|nr:hypothetical protein EMCG_06194 [Emmonsia crescens UAMH 3008]
MELTISDAEKRAATVNDMIEWLWNDGFYRGEVGWSAEWDPDAIFGPPSSSSEAYVFGMSTSSGEKADEQHGQLQLDLNVDMDMDINAGFRETAVDAAHEKYVKKMIRKHKKLVPEALQEIDQRLLKAGVSVEELASLTTRRATDAYKKLARLDQATGKCTASTRLQFRVMSDLLPGEWMAVDIYLPRTCQLGDFESSMLRHRLVLYLNRPTLTSDGTLPENLAGAQQIASQILTKKLGCDKKVWAYKIAERDKGDADKRTLEGWKALCNEEDFAEFMQALLKDESKEAKMAIICHETTLEEMKEEKEKLRETAVEDKPRFYTWDGELDDYSNTGDTSMAVDGCIPIPEDFDWSQVIDGKVAGWEEDPLN